tara:strand:+ start:944 stop:1723 length:780 start_codon:yes stop_codon:yes gene_type:complete
MVKKKFREYSKFSIENPEVWVEGQKEDAPKDIKSLISIFKKFGKVKKVLDVGCGMGAHVKALNYQGYDCVGVDFNPEMVKFSKEKYPSLDFDVQDMRTLKVKGKFDALICLHNVIAYNGSNEDVVKTLKAFSKHLKKNGLVIIHTLNPMSFIQNKNFREHFVDTGKDRKKFGIKAIVKEAINERNQTILSTRTFYTLKGNKKVGSYHKESRLFFPQELRFFLEQSGFEVLEFYDGNLANLNLKDTKLDKLRMLVVARKR